MRTSKSQQIVAYVRHFIICVAILVFLPAISGCSKEKHSNKPIATALSTNAAVVEAVAAGNFLRELQMQNLLPGISNTDHGKVNSMDVDFTKPEYYPISRTFFILKEGDKSGSTYCYTVTRKDKMYEWQLTKAWRIDSKSNILQQWPVD